MENLAETFFDDEAEPITACIDFDFDAIDGKASDAGPDIQFAVKFTRKVLAWIWDNHNPEQRGLAIRAAIMCWTFDPRLQNLTATDLACGLGLHKQSVDRWIQKRDKDFPNLKPKQLKWTSQ